MAANETIPPFQFEDESEIEAVEKQLEEDTHMDLVASPGQWKKLDWLEAHLLIGGLPVGSYTEVVNTTSEAATLAVLRALQYGTLNLPHLPHSTPAPCDPLKSDGNETETRDLQPFKRRRACVQVDM